MYGSYLNNWAAKMEFPVHSGCKTACRRALVTSDRFSTVTGKKSGNYPSSRRADLHKHPLTAHSQVRLLPQPGKRIRELTRKCCLASCDFCLKMLSPRSVLLGALKYSLFNFMIESLHNSVGSSPTRGAILFIYVQAFTVAASTTSIVPTLVNSKPSQGARLPSRVNWPRIIARRVGCSLDTPACAVPAQGVSQVPPAPDSQLFPAADRALR